MPFFDFTSAAPKKSIFLQTQFKLAQIREPLFWHYAVCKWFECNKQNISVWPKHVFSKWEGWGGNVYFELSLYEKKSELIIFLIIAYVRGKAPWKVNLNGNSDDWNLIFNAADRMGQWEIKIKNRVLINTQCDLFDFDLNITN